MSGGMVDPDNRCEGCAFYRETVPARTRGLVRFEDGSTGFYLGAGECRINPPKTHGWPRVQSRDWCGCWTEKALGQ